MKLTILYVVAVVGAGRLGCPKRKRKATQAQTQTVITILLVWFIITLAMLVLLFADQSFSKATIELMRHLAP
jgi:uncharacterized membrane protein